jgi:hypothetical protein
MSFIFVHCEFTDSLVAVHTTYLGLFIVSSFADRIDKK